jgi:hypothetical protein
MKLVNVIKVFMVKPVYLVKMIELIAMDIKELDIVIHLIKTLEELNLELVLNVN